jgi:hypothetical protein
MSEEFLCPFSKCIIGKWCACSYARLYERCSGKMICTRADEFLDSCNSLVATLKEKSRFALGLSEEVELTHAQLMKIRCGGLLGMQRLLQHELDRPPVVRETISETEARYGDIENFPFNEIMKDIQGFRHRKRK